MIAFIEQFPKKTYLGTTIETNRSYPEMGNAPAPEKRAHALHHLSSSGFHTMLTIEPIMDFDFDYLYHLVCLCNPKWINIGADSKDHNLPEPSTDKIKDLIFQLKGSGIDVKVKDNLKRLTKGDYHDQTISKA
jgi:hypothetical protein